MVEVQIPCLLSLSHLDGFLPLVGTLWGGMFDSTQLHGVERWDFDGTLMINTLRPELMSAHWVQFWSWMALFDYPLAKPDCFMDIQNDFRRLCEFYISARYWMSSLHCLATVTCLQHLCWEVIIWLLLRKWPIVLFRLLSPSTSIGLLRDSILSSESGISILADRDKSGPSVL